MDREKQVWSSEFTVRAARRVGEPEPNWRRECRLHPAVVRSLQRFQVGESGAGEHLIRKAAGIGDQDYESAIRFFVAEEQNHARMLEQLLLAAGASTIQKHWSDRTFVLIRRLMGLRLELMVLSIAEIVALRYYRALAEGGGDPLLTEVSTRILDDERHHVPFQCRRLKVAFQRTPRFVTGPIEYSWRALALAVTVAVAADHAAALRVCGVGQHTFVSETMTLFDGAVATVFGKDRPR